MMKLTSVLVFAAIAGMCIVSTVSLDPTTYDPDGLWYVVGQDMKAELNLQCWDALIATRGPGLHGTGVTHFTDSQGARKIVEFKFWNPFSDAKMEPAVIAVSQKMKSGRYTPRGDMVLSLIDENTMILRNTYAIGGLKFKYVVLSRDPAHQLQLSSYPFKTVDNTCAPAQAN